MRILLLTQWFQPEPHFKGLPLAKALLERGHEVEVLTGFPNYPGGKLYNGYHVRPWQRETIDGVHITRAALYPSHDRSAFRRILNYVSFAASSMLLAFAIRRPDVIYVYCPPMTAAAGALALRLIRGTPYVVDIQDLWPDTLSSTGMVSSGWIMRLVGAWSDLAMRKATRLVVLSSGFKKRLVERGVRTPIDVIPNWAPCEIVAQGAALKLKGVPPTPGEHGKAFNVLFAGNMGRAQGLETVISAAALLKQQQVPIQFTLVGGGVEVSHLQNLREKKGADNVSFLSHRPVTEMGPIFAAADALLVHLRDDPLFEITIPSKVQAYLAIGRPILLGVRGDAAAIIDAAGAGFTFKPEDPEALASAVLMLAAMPPDARAAMGRAGTEYYDRHLAFDKGIDALENVLSYAASTAKRD